MLQASRAFSGFAVDDVDAARSFYAQTLGIEVKEMPVGLELKLGGDTSVFIYPKPQHEPASFTILNFPVTDLEGIIDALVERGVVMEQYDEPELKTDARGIAIGSGSENGPKIAWFRDPAGNILSVMEESDM